jgi:hypothetical protein
MMKSTKVCVAALTAVLGIATNSAIWASPANNGEGDQGHHNASDHNYKQHPVANSPGFAKDDGYPEGTEPCDRYNERDCDDPANCSSDGQD